MKIRFLLAAALLTASAIAAEYPVISQGYELRPLDFQAPATANGGVVFRSCDSCDYQRVRVTPSTRYAVDGTAVELADFRRSLLEVRDRSRHSITLLHHLETDTVVSIDLWN